MRYLVGYSEVEFQEQEFAIVEAPTEADATLAFVRQVAIHDSYFQENLNERSVNMSFAERFWIEAGGVDVFSLDGKALAAAEAAFRERIHIFFGPHPAYAGLYLDYYFQPRFDAEPSAPDPPFPDDMLLFIWLHSDYSRLTTVALDDIFKVAV